MSVKKRILLGILILLVLASAAAFIVYDWNNKHPLYSFTKIVEKGDFSNLRLKIYYVDWGIETIIPLKVENVIAMSQSEDDSLVKCYVVVTGNELKEHMDLLNRLSKQVLKPVKPKPRLDARVYYVFETTKGKKILDIAMWNIDGSIYVKGIAVEDSDDIFLEVIIPYMPEDAAQQLQKIVDFSES